MLIDANTTLCLKLQQIGWLNFIQKFHGHNLEVARQFAATFDGKRDVIGNLDLPVSRQSISEATGLLDEGEEWFKTGQIDKKVIPWNHFFKPKTPQDFGKGLPVKLLKKKYLELMHVIKQYITCEGRYSLVLSFHIRLLMVFEDKTLNFPYFLFRSLMKMSKAYQKKLDYTSLFHHGLIQIILEYELIKYHISWERFLSKIQLSDQKNLRNYYANNLSSEDKNSPHDPKVNDEVKPEKLKKISQPAIAKTVITYLPNSSDGKIDINIVNFANKRNVRLSFRMARNQKKVEDKPDCIDLEEDSIDNMEETPATSSIAHVILDLQVCQPTVESTSEEEEVPRDNYASEPENDSEEDNKASECQNCLNYASEVQNLKSDIAELHKEIHKLKRQKRLLTENYELEIVEFNKKSKNTDSGYKLVGSGINIIIHFEGKSASKSDKSDIDKKTGMCIFVFK